MLWTDSTHLSNSSFFIHELFHFDTQFDKISANQYIILRYLEFLLTSCNELGISSPTHFNSYYYENYEEETKVSDMSLIILLYANTLVLIF